MPEPRKPETPQQGPETPQQAIDRIFNRKPKSKGAQGKVSKKKPAYTNPFFEQMAKNAKAKEEEGWESAKKRQKSEAEGKSAQREKDLEELRERREKKDLFKRLVDSRKDRLNIHGLPSFDGGDLLETARIGLGGDTSKTEDLIEKRARNAKLRSKLTSIPGRAFEGAKASVADLLKEGEE